MKTLEEYREAMEEARANQAKADSTYIRACQAYDEARHQAYEKGAK